MFAVCAHIVESMYTVCTKPVLVRRQKTRKAPFYRCNHCKKARRAFFSVTAVCAKWRLDFISIVKLLFYFKLNFPVKTIFRLFGGDLPGDRGSPITRKLIGK